jgi:hypothetical protein
MTPTQQRDYDFVSKLTAITVEEFNELKISIGSWWYSNPDYALKIVKEARVNKYRNEQLTRFDFKSWKAGNCYHKGYESWRRQDGNPISPKDEAAIKSICKGQENFFTGAAGDLHIKLNWSCDSSG